MKIIGITGGTGAGKTTALSVLHEMGAHIIDCDKVYHELLESSPELIREIDGHFDGVVSRGRLDRRKLGDIVFKDPNKLEKLNIITHKYVGNEVWRQIRREEKSGRALVAIDAVALIESGISGMCDTVVSVVAPREARIRRIMDREGIDEKYAALRVSAQPPDEFYIQNAQYVLTNDYGTSEEFRVKCRELFNEITGGI